MNFNEDIDDVELDVTVEDDENIYLKDASKGLALIAKILSLPEKEEYGTRRIRQFIQQSLLGSLSRINLNNEMMYYRQLEKIGNQIQEIKDIKDLKKKIVIGVGGGFSAGKSRFINTILGNPDDFILPENQGPSTSIPTFIVKSDLDEILAITFDSKKVNLDREEVKALAHQFYDRYHFGFSQYIRRLLVKCSTFPYENLAILDTPGYTKDDSNKIKDAKDIIRAKEQLKISDYVIWVIEPGSGGGLTGTDIEFLRDIGSEKPILFIVNKCDKFSMDNIQPIVDNVKHLSKDEGFKIVDVLKYSSNNYHEFERNKLESYLEKFNNSAVLSDQEQDIFEVVGTIKRELIQERNDCKVKLNKLNSMIRDSMNPNTIRAMVGLHQQFMKKFASINYGEYAFECAKKNLRDMVLRNYE